MSIPAPTFHQAHSITHRVKAALRAESYGFEAAQIAWQFAETVKRANEMLRRCADRLSKGEATDAYVAFESNRQLMETVETLEMDAWDAWKLRCGTYAWSQPEDLKTSVAQILSEAFNDIASLKNTLLDEYRSRIHRKGPREGYAIIKLLARSLPEDGPVQAEFKRVTTELINELEADLIVCYGSSKAADDSVAALAKYRACGLELPAQQGPIDDAIGAERKQALAKCDKEIAAALAAHPNVGDTDRWKSAEQSYFPLEQKLVDAPLSPDDKAKLLEKLRPLREQIARQRGGHDAVLAIGATLAALQAKPKDRTFAEALTAQAAHAKLMELPLPAPLADAIASALANFPQPKSAPKSQPKQASPGSAGKSKTPLFIAGGIAAVVAIGGIIAFSGGSGDGDSDSPPHVAAATPAAPSADAFPAALQSLQQKAAEPYSASDDAEFAKLLQSARTLASAGSRDPQASAQVEAAAALRQTARDNHLAHFRLAAEERIEQAERALGAIAERAGSESFADLVASAEASIKAARKAVGQTDRPEAMAATLVKLDERLEQAIADEDARLSALGSLASSETVAEYFRNLAQLLADGDLAPEAQAQAQSLLERKEHLDEAIARLVQFEDLAATSPLRIDAQSGSAGIELNDEERAMLDTLIDRDDFARTYVSEVKYFRSSKEPLSTQRAYLAEPVTATTQTTGPRSNTVFSVRGFDDDGFARSAALQASFARNADGEGTGHFYEESQLTPESEYYAQTLNPALKQLRSGPDPLDPIRLIAEVSNQRQLAPLFRLFWIQQIDSIMSVRPNEWPYRQTPSLERARQRIEAYSPAPIAPTRWIAVGPNVSDRAALEAFIDDIALSHLAEESTAFALIAGLAGKGQFVVVGHIDGDGRAQPRNTSAKSDALWSVDTASGKLIPFTATAALSPFAPIFEYRVAGLASRETLAATSERTGVDLLQELYAEHLPQVLRQ